MNAATVTARPAERVGGRVNTLLWAAQIVLAAFFAFAAVPKLAGGHSTVLATPAQWEALRGPLDSK